MRRDLVAVAGALFAVSGLGLLGASPAEAATPGAVVCNLTDPALSNATGLATTSTGYALVRSDAQAVYLLDRQCRRKSTLRYPATANSPQDVSVGKDGNLWVADTGDGAGDRTRVAVWRLPLNGNRGSLYRFTYPDGAHPDVWAMVLTGNDVPVFITKSTNGPAAIYAPSGALVSGGTVALSKVGTFTPQNTNTSNPLGAVGTTIVTGGAVSADGTKVALRTYADAYVWTVTNGDVVAAITTGKPVVTSLPDETAGQAVTFGTDNQTLVTVSNTTVTDTAATPILSYAPVAPAVAVAPSGSAAARAAPTRAARTTSWFDNLDHVTYVVAAVGVLGLLMVVGGIVGIRRARRRIAGPVDLTARGVGTASVSYGQPESGGYPDSGGTPYPEGGGAPYGDGGYGQPYGSGYDQSYGQQPYGDQPVGDQSYGDAAGPAAPKSSNVYGRPSR